MSLADRLVVSELLVTGNMNRVEIVLGKLEPKDKKALEGALADRTFSSAFISKALKSEGHNVGPTSIRTYRDKRGL